MLKSSCFDHKLIHVTMYKNKIKKFKNLKYSLHWVTFRIYHYFWGGVFLGYFDL